MNPGDHVGIVSPSWGGASLFPHRAKKGVEQIERRQFSCAEFRQDKTSNSLLIMSLKSPTRSNRFPHVHPDHTLDIALQRMGTSGLKTLPVVSRSDIHRLEGIIAIEDVMKAYGLSTPC